MIAALQRLRVERSRSRDYNNNNNGSSNNNSESSNNNDNEQHMSQTGIPTAMSNASGALPVGSMSSQQESDDNQNESSRNNSVDEDDVDNENQSSLLTQQEEMEHYNMIVENYRRQSIVLLILALFLAKLWIEAIVSQDEGLILFCMIMTLYGAKAWQRRREAEREMVRQGGNEDGIRNLSLTYYSFQTQLAHALAESQRMHAMAQANGGMPDNSSSAEIGVSDSIRSKWKQTVYGFDKGTSDDDGKSCLVSIKSNDVNHSEDEIKQDKKTGVINKIRSKFKKGKNKSYKSVSESDNIENEDSNEFVDLEENGPVYSQDQHLSNQHPGLFSSLPENEDEVACSICLCEYENGDKLITLPCNHVYHADCIKSWTDKSTRCPLCNLDLNE